MRTNEVLIAQARSNAEIQDEALKIAQSRFQNGATSELDVTQATTLLESTRATIPQLQGQLQQARNALSTLLGQPPGIAESLLAGPQEIPKAPEKVAVSVPAEMLRRRPDIRSAELNAAAQCARIGVAKADLYPSFSLFGSIGLQAIGQRVGRHNLFSTNSFFYPAGPIGQLAVPQLRPHREQRARRGRALPAVARRPTATPCSGRRRRSRTRWPGSSTRRRRWCSSRAR